MSVSKPHSIQDDFSNVREAMSRYNGRGSYEERRLWFEEGTLSLQRIEEQLEAVSAQRERIRHDLAWLVSQWRAKGPLDPAEALAAVLYQIEREAPNPASGRLREHGRGLIADLEASNQESSQGK